MIDEQGMARKAFVRIADISMAMGLDDEDERLLWEYVAIQVHKNILVPGTITQVLSEQAQLDPCFIVNVDITATIDQRFVIQDKKRYGLRKPKPRALSKHSSIDVLDVVYDLDEYKKKSDSRARSVIFQDWYWLLAPALREDGVNWEPPCASDINMQIHLTHFSLRDKITI